MARIDAFYREMPDGTIKQINPFTGTEVWAVPGRGKKPVTNAPPPKDRKKLTKKKEEDYCNFCEAKIYNTPPEKARLVKKGRTYKIVKGVLPSEYKKTKPLFRRVANLFEIVTIDYWKKNYDFRLSENQKKWKNKYLSTSVGMEHAIHVLTMKLKIMGMSEEEIDNIPIEKKIEMMDAFFGGGHELIIAGKHYRDGAKYDDELLSSGFLTPQEHFWYFKFTIEAAKDIYANNRYVRYISIFQNWLRPAGASFDHLHKQLVAVDEWGNSVEKELDFVRKNPNAYNEYAANFAGYKNLVFAENDYALAFVEIGHRYPTLAIYSKSDKPSPMEMSNDEIRGMSDLVHACHRAMGSALSCNEEWYYTPRDSIVKMPWHILIKWRINTPAGFEGGTKIYINPLTPVAIRDQVVPRLYELRDKKVIRVDKIAEECPCDPNPLKYYINNMR